MTVGELVKALKKFDEDAEVVVKGIVDTSEWRSLCPAPCRRWPYSRR